MGPRLESERMRKRSKSPAERAVRPAEATDAEAIRKALQSQPDPEADERSLIRERIAWSPAERLAANGAFVAFALGVRPQGPLLRD